MKFGLKEETINKINSVFVKFGEIQKVIIYGSRAKGNFRNGSDIDITLIGNNLNYDTLLKVSNEIEDLDTPYMFDISIYEQLNSDSLKEHIDRIGLVFYQQM